MLKRTAVLWLLAAGCGRVGFEPWPTPVVGDAGRRADADRTGTDADVGDASSGDASSGDASAGDPNSGDPSAGDPSSGDPSAGDPSAGDPSAGDPSAGDPSAGDPSAGDPSAGDPGGGDAWIGIPETPIGVVLDECSFGICFIGDNIGLRWDPTPGATYYEVRWICSVSQLISGPLTETDYADALGPPINFAAASCGFSTFNFEVCACNSTGCTCAAIPPPTPITCGGDACAW